MISLTALILALILACSPTKPGIEIFKSEGCVVCHNHSGIGTGNVDLTEVAKRRSDDWIREHLKNPKIHDPNIGMPSFAHLSRSEVMALLQFLHTGK